MKDVQCYELFGGIAFKNHAFSFFSFIYIYILKDRFATDCIGLSMRIQKPTTRKIKSC